MNNETYVYTKNKTRLNLTDIPIIGNWYTSDFSNKAEREVREAIRKKKNKEYVNI